MARIKFLVLIAVAISVSAESPTRVQQRRNSKFLARQEVAPAQTATTVAPEQAPYAASGFRPGRKFDLPTETEAARAAETTPEPTAAAPAPTGVPADRYGPPEEATTTISPQADQAPAAADNPDSEVEDLARNTAASSEPENNVNEVEQGLYYVQLPNGIQQIVVGVPENKQNLKLASIVQDQPIILAANGPQSYSYVSQFTTF